MVENELNHSWSKIKLHSRKLVNVLVYSNTCHVFWRRGVGGLEISRIRLETYDMHITGKFQVLDPVWLVSMRAFESIAGYCKCSHRAFLFDCPSC